MIEPFVNEYVGKYGGLKYPNDEDDSSMRIVGGKKGSSDYARK